MEDRELRSLCDRLRTAPTILPAELAREAFEALRTARLNGDEETQTAIVEASTPRTR